MKTHVIGDVHGCLRELEELLELLQPNTTDTVVFCGDLVHKGPDSAGVVKRVMALRQEVRWVTVVRGNHEDTELRRRELPLNDAEWAFLKECPHWVAVPGGIVVHAGISPKLEALLPAEEIRTLSNSKRRLFDQMLRLRYTNGGGDFVALNDVKPEHEFWASRYDGRFGHVWFGHEPWRTELPRQFDYATGLDLGCVFGGYLAAVTLETGAPPIYSKVQGQPYCSWLNLGD